MAVEGEEFERPLRLFAFLNNFAAHARSLKHQIQNLKLASQALVKSEKFAVVIGMIFDLLKKFDPEQEHVRYELGLGLLHVVSRRKFR